MTPHRGVFVGLASVALLLLAGGARATPPTIAVALRANATLAAGNQAEPTIAVNPTNTSNVVVVSQPQAGGSFHRAYSFDGGATWTRGQILAGAVCCSPQMVFDGFGNLFLVFINAAANQVMLATSTDGGVTFGLPVAVGGGAIDQPSVAAAAGSVWLSWNLSGAIVARGAPVTGLGVVGGFGPQQAAPTATGDFGDIAVGPLGQVTVTYQDGVGGQGPATIYVNTDADGLGAGGFGARVTVSTTNVGGFDFIPAQSGRSIDAEANLAYDRSGGAHNGRLYLVYTTETVNENNDTEIFVRSSDNSGTTWSAPVRANDDAVGPIRSQFLPRLSVDQTTGNVGVTWYDARNDGGVAGSGSTNAIPNDDAMYYGTVSNDGGATFAPNVQISTGVSNDDVASSAVDYGDYSWNDFAGGRLYAAWADNSNSTGDNPDGTLRTFDVYAARLTVGAPTAVEVSGFRASRRADGSVVLRWRTAEETRLAGFDVYRGRKRVNRTLVRARAAGQASGASYRLVDPPAHGAGVVYRLEAVGLDGSRAWSGPAVVGKG